MSQTIVIGAGQAGSACVAKLRALGFDGQITLIGREPVVPYQRPPLSKGYLLGEITVERLFLRPPEFYAENDIEVLTDTDVLAIDRDAGTIRTSDGNLPYDHLVLTTGSDPRPLPDAIGGSLAGVHTVRTLADVDAMAPAVEEGGKALIIGGGYIGLEAAAVCRKRGMHVTLVELSDRILQRVAAPETADFFRQLHTEQGVDIREGTGLVRLLGDHKVSGADLTDGSSLDCDLVVVGIGVEPAAGLARDAGLRIDNGIAVNEYGQSSDPKIWSAGDCASFPLGDRRIRLESVQNAIDQAECVAQNIVSLGTPYRPEPWFWSDQYDVKLQIAGLNTGYDEVVVRQSGNGQSHWYFAGGRLIAVDAMNDPRAYMVGKRLIAGAISVEPASLADPETDLKALLKG